MRITPFKHEGVLILVFHRWLLPDIVKRYKPKNKHLIDWYDLDTLHTDPFWVWGRLIGFNQLQLAWKEAAELDPTHLDSQLRENVLETLIGRDVEWHPDGTATVTDKYVTAKESTRVSPGERL